MKKVQITLLRHWPSCKCSVATRDCTDEWISLCRVLLDFMLGCFLLLIVQYQRWLCKLRRKEVYFGSPSRASIWRWVSCWQYSEVVHHSTRVWDWCGVCACALFIKLLGFSHRAPPWWPYPVLISSLRPNSEHQIGLNFHNFHPFNNSSRGLNFIP